MKAVEIHWHCAALNSSEHCVLSQTTDGWRIKGVTVVPFDGVPAHIDYSVDVDQKWATRHAEITVHGPRAQTLDVSSSNGQWTVNGDQRDDLVGCVDIDLGWTPSTNTLPIRRLGLEVDETASTTAAWLKFPELQFQATQQSYTRTAECEWRYVAGASDYDISVNEHGLVTSYGTNLWRMVTIED